MKTTIKIKGSEIINRWNELNDLVNTLGESLGEKGSFFRKHGYDVTYDGFNVCDVECRDILLRFSVSNCDSIWTLSKIIWGHGVLGYIQGIDPNKEYDVPANISIAKLFEQGTIKPTKFIVSEQTGRRYERLASFDKFEDAENYAKQAFNDNVKLLSRDRDLRRFCHFKFEDSQQTAKEKGELRHYTFYDYNGHTNWVAIDITL